MGDNYLLHSDGYISGGGPNPGRGQKILGARGWGKLSVLFNPGQGGPEFVHLWFERRSKP